MLFAPRKPEYYLCVLFFLCYRSGMVETPIPAAAHRRRLAPLLRRTWYSLNQTFRRRIAHAGLTPDQFSVLRWLSASRAYLLWCLVRRRSDCGWRRDPCLGRVLCWLLPLRRWWWRRQMVSTHFLSATATR